MRWHVKFQGLPLHLPPKKIWKKWQKKIKIKNKNEKSNKKFLKVPNIRDFIVLVLPPAHIERLFASCIQDYFNGVKKNSAIYQNQIKIRGLFHVWHHCLLFYLVLSMGGWNDLSPTQKPALNTRVLMLATKGCVKKRLPETFKCSEYKMWGPRELKLHQSVYLVLINRLVKFQLPRSLHFGFRAFQSFKQPRFFTHPLTKFCRTQPLQMVGRISMALYLVHRPVSEGIDAIQVKNTIELFPNAVFKSLKGTIELVWTGTLKQACCAGCR